MCGNRVEELESRVKELEASVEGLTDELVECKVRLRELESTVDEDGGIGHAGTNDADGETTEATGTDTGTTESATADTPKPEDANAGDNREESEADSGSDIIVA